MFTVLKRHVSTHTSHLQVRTILVYDVTVSFWDPRRLHVFYIDVIYCIIIGGCCKRHCYSINLITLDVFYVRMDSGFCLVCYVRRLD